MTFKYFIYLTELSCRSYAQQLDGSFNFTETSGAGKCPYDPRHNSTYVHVGEYVRRPEECTAGK